MMIVAQIVSGQVSRAPKISKGPRALGLLALTPNGKARLIPVMILYDGKYYDAGAFKASPVPMALWSETTYEAVRTGVSQGLFTVSVALQNQQTNEWIAEGTWQTAAQLEAAKAARKPSSSEPRGLDQDEGPPVLRHSGPAKPKPPEPAPAPSPPPTPSPTAPAPTAQPTPATTASASPPAPGAEPEDANRPTLKRGKPAPTAPEALTTPVPAKPKAAQPAQTSASAKPEQLQLIPAISDADGPDFQPYAYEVRPDEEQQFRKKMLALAADEVLARDKQLASERISEENPKPRPRAAAKAKPVEPSFENVQLRIFDLSNSNEPTLVLTATARMPQGTTEGGTNLQYLVTLVAREDINGDFHKAFSTVTDTQHLDAIPRYELIDAVDADGDGRGELLFRKISDAGSAFVVYRVIGDQLYALFEGTVGE